MFYANISNIKYIIYKYMATIKQQLAFVKIMENRGNISKSMREAGYTKASAKNPSNLTKSKGMKELIENYVPNKSLALAHKKILSGSNDKITLKALNMIYKIKNLY